MKAQIDFGYTRHAGPESSSTSIFNAALKAHEKKTRKDLLPHPLAVQLQACKSPNEILVALQDKIKDFDKSSSADERLSRWLNPTFNVLYAFSATLGGCVGLVFLPAQLIFSGVGVLLSSFLHRVLYGIATNRRDDSHNRGDIMIEVLNVFAIATKEMRQGRAKKYLKRLIGKREIEDALNRLDKLTQEKARMAAAEVLRLTQIVDNQVTIVINGKSGKSATRETSF
ncbi:hypothetical protein EI94DRAFT_1706651 [Lactarius quietus]|nr:hypothetical protein EI94DRAFT_1706651 [Lactarius quietus]